MKTGGEYIKNKTIVRQLDADLIELKNNGYNILEKIKTNGNSEVNDIYFKAVICMLGNLTEIRCISINTYSGFIFYIKSSKSYFKKKVGSKEEDVYDLLLKFSIVGKLNNKYTYAGYDKEYVVPERVNNECQIQQMVYNINSITKYKICPSVLDASTFNSNDAINAVITLLQSIDANEASTNVLNTLKKTTCNINDYYGICK